MPVAVDQMRVEDPEKAAVLLHPMRSSILSRLRHPASATEVARDLGHPAPRINHHFRRLREVGLIRRAGSRRVRNLVEVRYVALARTWVIAEELTPGGIERQVIRRETARRPLRNLVAVGERLSGDALGLLDEVARDDREFSTYATALDLSFPDASSRAAFLADLLAAVKSLRERYGGKEGAASPPDGEAPGDRAAGSGATDSGAADEARYTTIVACYPDRRRG